MAREVVAADLHTTVKAGAEIMRSRRHGYLIVISKNLAVGIVTEPDIVQKVTAEGGSGKSFVRRYHVHATDNGKSYCYHQRGC